MSPTLAVARVGGGDRRALVVARNASRELLQRIFPRPIYRSDCVINSYRNSTSFCIHEYICDYVDYLFICRFCRI